MRRKGFTEDECKEMCEVRSLDFVGAHKEKGKGLIVDFVCRNHADKGIQPLAASNLNRYTYGCRYCSGRGKTNADIEKEIKNKDVELISEYKGCEKDIRCRCRKCGYEWTTLPKVLTTNGSGCPKCGRKMANQHEMKSHDDFVHDLAEVAPHIDVIGTYIGTHRKVRCRCTIDGTEWDAYPANLLNRSAGCPFCNISTGEQTMLNTLKAMDIQFEPQYPVDMGLKRKSRFDAYNVEHRIAFEYNGQQHYYPVDFAGRGPEWAMKSYEVTKKRDDVKKNYCEENGISMVIVPYWERDNMESFISKELKERNLKI